ncbi:MAG: TolB family protein, partial [Chloroflexota bacterium]
LLLGGPGDDSTPGFSPDGTRVAFFRDVPVASGTSLPVDLYVMKADGSGVTKISPSPMYSVGEAAWAPDGRHIAVVHPDGPLDRLDLFDTSGSLPPQRIDAAVGIDTMAFRPPDGHEILFRALVNGKYGLFTINADGSRRQTLVDPVNTTDIDQDLNSATYSADGSRIFYQRWFPDSIQLWVMNADGTDQHRFDTQVAPAWSGVPVPSPDGKWIAYWHVFEDGRATQRVSVAPADGSGPIIQTGPELTGLARWVWSPDSTKILMRPDDGPTAYLLDPGGGAGTPVRWQGDLDIDWQTRRARLTESWGRSSHGGRPFSVTVPSWVGPIVST